jgi:hypothetical protein
MPATRHERDRWRRAADRASHPPSSPRIASTGRPSGSDLLTEFAGLRVGPAPGCGGCPGFVKTRYSRSTVATTTRATTAPVALVANTRSAESCRSRPASVLARALWALHCHRRR